MFNSLLNIVISALSVYLAENNSPDIVRTRDTATHHSHCFHVTYAELIGH